MRGSALDAGSLNRSGSVAVAPDGANLYVAAAQRGAVVVMRRDPLTGSIRQSGCVAGGAAPGGCDSAEAVEGATAVDVSPDGLNVYAVSSGQGAVAAFSRASRDGSLRQASCSGPGPPGCARGSALSGASDVAVSPDGAHVYVASRRSSSLTVFRRVPSTGALTQVSCLAAGGAAGCTRRDSLAGANSVSLSAHGARAYATGSDAVTVLGRRPSSGALQPLACASVDGSGGACSRWAAVDGASSAAPSPDGRHLYVTARLANALTAFRVSAASGRLTVAGCLSEDGSGRRCARGYALDGAAAASVAPDGRSLYLASGRFSHGLSQFRRDPGTGRVRQLGCINRSRAGGACARGHALGGASTAMLSPDGRNVYVLGSESDALAVFGPDVGIVGRRWRVGAGGTTRVRLACPRNARGRCQGVLRLRAVRRTFVRGPARQAVVGSARFSVPRGQRRWVRVRLGSRFVAPIRRAGSLRVRPTVSRR